MHVISRWSRRPSHLRVFHLVAIGVPFPHDRLGNTSDTRRTTIQERATSAGPWTSNQMFSQLLKEVMTRGIPILDSHEVIAILTSTSAGVTEAVAHCL